MPEAVINGLQVLLGVVIGLAFLGAWWLLEGWHDRRAAKQRITAEFERQGYEVVHIEPCPSEKGSWHVLYIERAVHD